MMREDAKAIAYVYTKRTAVSIRRDLIVDKSLERNDRDVWRETGIEGSEKGKYMMRREERGERERREERGKREEGEGRGERGERRQMTG